MEEFQSLGGNAEILRERLLQAFRNEHGEEPGEADFEQARKVADAILKKRPRPRSMISQKGDGQTPVVAPRRGKAKVAEVSNALANPAVSPLEKGNDSTKLQAPPGSNSELDLSTDGSKASGTEAALQRGNELNLGSSQLPLPAAAGGNGASGDVPVQTSEVAKDNADPAVDRAGGR